jgi:parallel beta-helix repeat protein
VCAAVLLATLIIGRPWLGTGSSNPSGGEAAGPEIASATLYVSPSGSDTNPCTQASHCREIRKALTLVGPGDTIEVADGQYKGFDVDNQDGAPGSPITIRAAGTGAVVVNTTDRPDNRDTIFITFSDWLVIDGLRSFDANRAAVRVDQSANVTVRNGVFGNNSRWGIFTDFSNDVLLENNECYGSRIEHGIYVSNSVDRPVVRGNRVHGNNANGLHFNGDISQGGHGLIRWALVENNIIWGNGNAGGGGINMDGPQDSVIRNNLLYDNHAGGITQYKIDAAAGPKNNLIAHNTIDQASNGRWAVLVRDTEGPMKLRNNILYNRNAARGGIAYGAAADVNNTDSDFNVMDRVTPDDGSTVLTLAQWQAQGHELNSTSATPAQLWVSPGADYHLSNSSKAIDIGQTLTEVQSDIEGNARPSGNSSDAGAYEHGSVPPPMTISASANPASGFAPLTVFFSANASGAKPPYTYEWQFGDGNTSNLQKPAHDYTQPGNYTAKVTARAQSPPRNASTTLSIEVRKRPVGTQNLTSVSISPATANVAANATADFSARALDQDGNKILTGVEWSWALSPAPLGSLSNTSGSSSTAFTAGASAGLGNLTALAKQGARTVSATAAIEVTAPSPPGKPPTIKITFPAAGATLKDVVAVKVTASSNTVKVQFRVDGAEKATIMAAPFEWAWDTRLHSDDAHVLRAVAFNSTGGSAHDEVTVMTENGKDEDGPLAGTPPWFFTLMLVFLLGMVFSVVFVAYTRHRRRRMREERRRQREYIEHGPPG